jgi:DNA mismatch endonuclease (patch repair protein)
MADTLTKAQRSARMSLVRNKDTGPELTVRKVVHGMGYRYRLHGKGLPGRPDLVFRKKKKVIFVHGCFWHRHGDSACKLARMPKSRLDFWEPKLTANRDRDDRNRRLLEADGWSVLVIWECELSDHRALTRRLRVYLEK